MDECIGDYLGDYSGDYLGYCFGECSRGYRGEKMGDYFSEYLGAYLPLPGVNNPRPVIKVPFFMCFLNSSKF